jgi:DNA-binding transcriptional regulator GbsR (MarR family)
MKLSQPMTRFILHWGEMGNRWGVNRSVAQIHALLYLLEEPQNADEICETLSMARSNVSNSLKELQSWGLVSIVHVLGDRRDHFTAQADIWDVVTTITKERKRREIEPTVAFLRLLNEELETDKATPEAAKKRIRELSVFTEEIANWYDQLAALPPASVLKLVRLGASVVKFLGR